MKHADFFEQIEPLSETNGNLSGGFAVLTPEEKNNIFGGKDKNNGKCTGNGNCINNDACYNNAQCRGNGICIDPAPPIVVPNSPYICGVVENQK